MRTLLVDEIGLIGDFTMTVPAALEFVMREREAGNDVAFWPHRDAQPVWEMLVPTFPVEIIRTEADRGAYDRVVTFDLHRTAGKSSTNQWYGAQGFFDDIGLPVPSVAPRAHLSFFGAGAPAFDYGLAPFARSLPPHERWPRERWQALVDAHPDRSFVLYGAAGIDDPNFVTGPNVTPMIGARLHRAVHSINHLRRGLISVSTGLAHLAFAVGQRVVLISNQGTFSSPPTAIRVAGGTKQPDLIDVDEVRACL